ncbi:MAG: hypothetical protein AAB897_00285 [Patescibacteria group bacterium]
MPRKLTTTLLIFWLILSVFGRAFAYDELTTHPALTDEIINFYNLAYPGDPVTAEERELIVSGSTLEDQPPRWINHFYDPVHNIAWTGENTGWLSEDIVQALRTIGLSTEEPLTSVDWVNNRVMQDRYSRYGGDRTWKQGLDYWAQGNQSEAYRTLGFTLHLLEDATVPEHTRNDPHAHALSGATGDYGSPYEEYTKKWTRETVGPLQIANGLKNSGVQPAARFSIEEYITEAARYSNRYFFTKDTVNDPAYEFPKITRSDENFGYGLDEKNSEFILARVGNRWNEQKNQYEIIYEILEKPAYYPILDAYFFRLSRKAVIEGAGAIKLFKEQARKYAADYAVNKEYQFQAVNRELIDSISFSNISLFGEVVKAWDATLSFFSDLGGLTLAIFDKYVATVGPGQTTVAPRSDSAAASTPSQPNLSEPVPAPAPITASPVAVETTQNNPEPSNPATSPAGEVAGATALSPEANTPIVWGVSGTPPPSGGGVSVSGGEPAPGDGGATPPQSSSTGELPPSPGLPQISGFTGEFKLDRLEIDFAWQAFTDASGTVPAYFLSQVEGETSTLVATTTATAISIPVPGYGQTFTYAIEAKDENNTQLSQIATTTVAVPDFLVDIQPMKDETSRGSHYSDNWYNLGTGFYGTVYALIFEGAMEGGNNPDVVYDSTVLIREFLDPDYSVLNRDFTVSQGKEFTREMKEVVIKNLNIPLQPNKYYRLWTINNLQNAYVALKGTTNPPCDSPCGDAMWNEFVGLVGKVDHIYRFYPYIRAVMQANFPPQSAPTSPAITALDFDPFHLGLGILWASSTDPDTADNLIKYEFNYSTSSELSPDGWGGVGGATSAGIQLEFPNSYTIGVRAKDDFSNTSAPTVTNWNFPEGFRPLVLSPSLGAGYQDFVLASGGVLSSVKVFTADISTSARFVDGVTCHLLLFDPESGGEPVATSETVYSGQSCTGSPVFSFDTLPGIIAGHTYRWYLYVNTHNISTSASLKFWGYGSDTGAGGFFGDPSLINAKFTLEGTGGTLFSN